ncbi:MAG: histidine kinase dimerization/phospho-acceptor domain-containing protein [Thermoanaerobaculales bacterium]
MKDPRLKPGGRDKLDVGRKIDPGRLEIVGHLAAGMAHELNNILFVIRGFSELARLDLADEDPVATRLDRIEEAIDRAEGLTRMVLETAHPSDDGPMAIQLHPLVKEGVKLVGEGLPDNVRVHQAIATDAAAVAVDPVRFFPMIVTLLRMAAEPLVADGGMLWATLIETKVEGMTADANLVLTVGSATGEDEDEVWGRLTSGGRAPMSPLPENESTAASICEIVRACGGEVRHRSIDQRELCFEVILPLSPNPAVR